jgi:hypothetical protein
MGPALGDLGAEHSTKEEVAFNMPTSYAPNLHDDPEEAKSKPIPLIVTIVLPCIGPRLGTTETTAHLDRYSNQDPSFVEKSKPVLLTLILTRPGPRPGTLHTTEVEETRMPCET